MGRKARIKVFMQIPERREWEFRGRRSVGGILAKLDINPETVIVIQGSSLLTPDEMVEAGMEIEVRPAISGGSGGGEI